MWLKIDVAPQMEVETNEIHLGDLPSEVINYILKWVVSKELDLRYLKFPVTN